MITRYVECRNCDEEIATNGEVEFCSGSCEEEFHREAEAPDLKATAEEALRLADAATPGPWTKRKGYANVVEQDHAAYEVMIGKDRLAFTHWYERNEQRHIVSTMIHSLEQAGADVALIAFSREALPALARGYLALLAELNTERTKVLQERDRTARWVRDAERWESRCTNTEADLRDAWSERDRAVAEAQRYREALLIAIEYVPKPDARNWPGPRISVSNDRRKCEEALASGAPAAAPEGGES